MDDIPLVSDQTNQDKSKSELVLKCLVWIFFVSAASSTQLKEDLFALFELIAPSLHTCNTSAFGESVLLLIPRRPDLHTGCSVHPLPPDSQRLSAGHRQLTDINCKSMLV